MRLQMHYVRSLKKFFKLLIGGGTASIACSMHGQKFERKTFKLLIGGSTASNACSMQGQKNDINENNLPMLLWAGYFCHSLYILLAVHLIGNMPSELRGMKDNNRKEPWLLSYPYVRNDLSRNANRLNCCGYHPS